MLRMISGVLGSQIVKMRNPYRKFFQDTEVEVVAPFVKVEAVVVWVLHHVGPFQIPILRILFNRSQVFHSWTIPTATILRLVRISSMRLLLFSKCAMHWIPHHRHSSFVENYCFGFSLDLLIMDRKISLQRIVSLPRVLECNLKTYL